MAVTKKKRSRVDSRSVRLFDKRQKRKGYTLKDKRDVEEEIKKYGNGVL
jgi:hypothetical protein